MYNYQNRSEYADINGFEWVETAQLIYTLTRPDVYNAIMMNPFYAATGNIFKNCRHYTGKDGVMQSASAVIYNLENGLQGYYLAGGQNQRRVDVFGNIVRDPRLLPKAGDDFYVEPIIWTVEHVQRVKYKYPQTTSN